MKLQIKVSLVFLFSVASASADEKLYNGSACTFSVNDDPQQDRFEPKFTNESGQTQTVVCQVVKDVETGDVEEVSVIADADMDEDTCRFFERQRDGDVLTWVHSQVSSTGAGINETFWFSGSAALDSGDSVAFGIQCDLPDQAFVYLYRIKEKVI